MYGPFISEKAGRIIMTLAHERLLPAVKDLQLFAIQAVSHKISFLKSFNRTELNQLDLRYRELNKNFFELYYHYSTPDELFKDIKLNNSIMTEEDGKIMADYFSSRGMMNSTFDEGFRLLESIEKQLNRSYQAADQRVATILSIVAITVSILSIIWQFAFQSLDITQRTSIEREGINKDIELYLQTLNGLN